MHQIYVVFSKYQDPITHALNFTSVKGAETNFSKQILSFLLTGYT